MGILKYILSVMRGKNREEAAEVESLMQMSSEEVNFLKIKEAAEMMDWRFWMEDEIYLIEYQGNQFAVGSSDYGLVISDSEWYQAYVPAPKVARLYEFVNGYRMPPGMVLYVESEAPDTYEFAGNKRVMLHPFVSVEDVASYMRNSFEEIFAAKEQVVQDVRNFTQSL